MSPYDQLDTWVDAHFDEEVRFLQSLVQVPTETPPGNNAPHAERTAELLKGFGFTVHGKMAHAAIPATGVDALQGAVAILNALYAQNTLYRGITSSVPGITHPYLNVGRIGG
jgi:acetylornithine deacetylase/succinyl-diaminopimelate desuccinylase-like protein